MLEDIHGMVRTFLPTTRGGVGSSNHFAAEAVRWSTYFGTSLHSAFSASHCGLIRRCAARSFRRVFGTSVVLNGDGPQRILMGTFQSMKWCLNKLKANFKTMWVGLQTILMSSFCLGFTSWEGGNTQVSPCEHSDIRSWFQIFFCYTQILGKLQDPISIFIVLNWVGEKNKGHQTRQNDRGEGQHLPSYSQLIGCHNTDSATKNLMDTCWATARTNRYYIYCHSHMLRWRIFRYLHLASFAGIKRNFI